MKFLRELEDGTRDTNGRILDLEVKWRTNLTSNDDGTVLYWSFASGIGVFKHDPATSEFEFAQMLEYDGNHPPVLLWDSSRSRLLANACYGNWWQYQAINGEPLTLGDRIRLPVPEVKSLQSSSQCGGSEAAFTDRTGNFLYFQFSKGLDVFALNLEGMNHVQSVKIDKIKQVILSNSNNHVYALTDDSLQVYDRSSETGNLTIVHSIKTESSSVMAISHDDQYLFVIDRFLRADASVFRLFPDQQPQLLGDLDAGSAWGWGSCDFVAPRKNLPAVDVFCTGFGFSLQWRPESSALVHTDYLGADQYDRFDNLVSNFGRIQAGVASPDGKHIYLATKNDSLAIFERVGNAGTQMSTAPVLTSETGSLRLPLAEFRDASASLCFSVELWGATASGNWMDSANWTLATGATKNCAPASGEMPFVEAATRILRIPEGKLLNDDGTTACFTAELQASEDYQHWTLLAGNYRDCR